MLKEFESNLLRNSLFTKKDKLLLAISGGLDSVVLAHVLKKGGYLFSLAHCNFQLRGSDSREDEKFCKALARRFKVKVFTKTFDTKTYAEEHQLTIQVAARDLRYAWFDELMETEKYSYLLTAHHVNDTLETTLINLLRGTGINGLKGIPEKAGYIVRPLLNFKRQELEKYARENKIAFRTDKSNSEDKYERNFLRLKVIPLLKQIQPSLEDTFMKTARHLSEEAAIVKQFLASRAIGMIRNEGGELRISKIRLKQEKFRESILNHLIGDMGFNDTQQQNILQSILSDSIPGKMFFSAGYELTIDREDLILRQIVADQGIETPIDSFRSLQKHPLFKITKLKKLVVPQKGELIINKQRLTFPLHLRGVQKGDKFRPFGMKGFKLLSDFMREKKFNAFEKRKCRVLVNGNGDIIWVAGFQSDDRYRVGPEDKHLLKLELRGEQ